jgi:hypothetical protein
MAMISKLFFILPSDASGVIGVDLNTLCAEFVAAVNGNEAYRLLSKINPEAVANVNIESIVDLIDEAAQKRAEEEEEEAATIRPDFDDEDVMEEIDSAPRKSVQ